MDRTKNKLATKRQWSVPGNEKPAKKSCKERNKKLKARRRKTIRKLGKVSSNTSMPSVNSTDSVIYIGTIPPKVFSSDVIDLTRSSSNFHYRTSVGRTNSLVEDKPISGCAWCSRSLGLSKWKKLNKMPSTSNVIQNRRAKLGMKRTSKSASTLMFLNDDNKMLYTKIFGTENPSIGDLNMFAMVFPRVGEYSDSSVQGDTSVYNEELTLEETLNICNADSECSVQ